MVEHLGADTLVHGFFYDEASSPKRSQITVRLNGVRSIAQGDVLPLHIDANKVHVFDTATGKRL